jgi:hypothetical protein
MSLTAINALQTSAFSRRENQHIKGLLVSLLFGKLKKAKSSYEA